MATSYGNQIFINMYNQFLSPLRYASLTSLCNILETTLCEIVWIGIRIMWHSGVSYLPMHCCELCMLVLYKVDIIIVSKCNLILLNNLHHSLTYSITTIFEFIIQFILCFWPDVLDTTQCTNLSKNTNWTCGPADQIIDWTTTFS